MAMQRYLAVASPPSPSSGHSHRTHILGGFVVGILTVLVVALLFYLIKTKLLPALRHRQLPQKLPQKLGQKGELNPQFAAINIFPFLSNYRPHQVNPIYCTLFLENHERNKIAHSSSLFG